MTETPPPYEHESKPETPLDDGRYDYWINEAQSKVKVVSIILMIVGVLVVFLGLYSLVTNVISIANPESVREQTRAIYEFFGYPYIRQSDGEVIASAAFGIFTTFVSFVLAGVQIYGAYCLMKLKHRGFAMAACIVAMLPCTGCCCISMPIGIWALVTLNSETVKHGFNAMRYAK